MPIRVLIVDDHAVVRSGLKLLLDAEDDLEVVGEAGNLQEAVFRTRSLKPDVILMDLEMPGLDGLEATREIRREPGVARRPWIIAVSAHDAADRRGVTVDAGMDDYLEKPLRRELLERAIGRVPA